MTGLPDYLLDNPHLPLRTGQVTKEVVSLILTVYGLTLNESDYKKAQVYKGSDGKLYFPLSNTDNTLLTTFVNKASGTVIPTVLTDTITPTFGSVDTSNWLGYQMTVFDEEQLSPFKTLSNGFTYDAMSGSLGDWGYTLQQLLEQYADYGDWKLSSFAEYSTAKFQLVFQGDVNTAPTELGLPASNGYAVVVNILSGKHTGLLCFLAQR